MKTLIIWHISKRTLQKKQIGMFNACHVVLTLIMMIIDVPSTPCYDAPGLCPTTPANLWLHGTALACSQGPRNSQVRVGVSRVGNQNALSKTPVRLIDLVGEVDFIGWVVELHNLINVAICFWNTTSQWSYFLVVVTVSQFSDGECVSSMVLNSFSLSTRKCDRDIAIKCRSIDSPAIPSPTLLLAENFEFLSPL